MDAVDVAYIFFECLVAVISISGNSLVISAFVRHRRLRSVTNYFIMSLAVVDMLVGLIGIPLFLYSMITTRPDHFTACLIVNTWIMMLCTVSIFHLLAVSFDRYAVIVWSPTTLAANSPDAGSSTGENHHRHTAGLLIGTAWTSGVLIGCLPLMGWNTGPRVGRARCQFAEIMDFTYLVFLYYSTIIIPTLIMVFCYVSIYVKVGRPPQQLLATADPGVKKRKLKRQHRVVKSLILVVSAFFVCWYPLYTMNAVTYYCPECRIPPGCFRVAIVLSHLSSAVNPFIYAYTMPGFKRAFADLLLCRFGERMRLLRYKRQRCRPKVAAEDEEDDKILATKLMKITSKNNNNDIIVVR